ncbi:hypothetical protein E0Z10_g9221 [Xylaria hypoxylon]|uniref:Nephrocystin 3-like N-terminal domain-containing protein n=1 Tax=Xylaria hypoxylon TaxID=37992 RepID=A0A4Z0Y660_9PEZI|nr:hypothetical protein E0Z10_g9221 [Xylaria hypoxylon]
MADNKSRSGIAGWLNRRRLKHVEAAPNPENVERFLRKRVPSFQETPPGPMLYNHREQAFKPEEDGAINDLEHIVTAHDNESPPELQAHSCSWDRVFSLMSEASETHKPKIYSNPMLAAGGDLASSYIDLIPDEYGLGLLKGGLAIIFETLKRKEENAQKILEVFETIPETILTINTAYALLDPEPEDENIKRDFYDTLVKDVPLLIAILRGSEAWYKKAVQFLTIRLPETLSIEEILERWSGKTSLLKSRVERMNTRILGSLKSKMDGIENVGTQIQTAETSIRTLLLSNSSLQHALMGKLQERITKQYSDIWRQQNLAACAMTGLYDEIRELSYQLSENRQVQGKPQQRRRDAIVTPIQLLGIIGISDHAAGDELEIVLRQARLFDPEIQGRAGWLIKTTEFRDWLRSERSTILLADGCLPEHGGLTTPMSGLCGALISSLMESQHNRVLFFFVGQHCDMQSSDRDGNGPRGLMKSLIAQLLLCSNMARLNLDFLTREYLEDLTRYHLEALCELSVQLLQQLPPTSQFYCIIDGISLYEQSLWLKDLEYVAAMLEHVVKGQRQSQRRSAPVKLLMTSPGKSIELVKRTWEYNSVWKHVSLASGQGITGIPRFGA